MAGDSMSTEPEPLNNVDTTSVIPAQRNRPPARPHRFVGGGSSVVIVGETVEEFINGLRELRARSGVSFADIARRGDMPRSTAHVIVSRDQLPARAEQVQQFVLGCGESPEVAEAWVRLWRQLRARTWQQRDETIPPTAAEPSGSAAVVSPADMPEPAEVNALIGTRALMALMIYTLLVVALSVSVTLLITNGA